MRPPSLRARLLPVLALCAATVPAGVARAQSAPGVSVVRIARGDGGVRLQVDGRDLLITGINWSYTPAGENYSYNLWAEPDAFIERVLADQMGLLKAMGVNAIRQMPDTPPRWVEYIHKKFGIYTAMNPLFGRYGIKVNGAWVGNVDYANPAHRKAILDETRAAIERYRGTPGILLWLLGNESNYGLEWTSFETSQTPTGDRAADRARPLYTLFGEAIAEIKRLDPDHPVSLTNGDLGYIDLVAEHCKGLDIFGANVYRGPSARDLFDVVKKKLDLPVLFSEFGADAFDARAGREDATAQAAIELRQWQEIYEQSAGKGRAGNAIGGFLFQFADGWWKTGQTIRLDEHDTTATWSNEAYGYDYVPGENNMNEEWFGIAALDPPDRDKFYRVRPRTAYYVLQAALRLDPYAPETTLDHIRAHFGAIDPAAFAPRYQAGEALHRINVLSWVRLSNLRFHVDATASAGNAATQRGDKVVFDHTESLYADLVLQPNAQIYGRVSVNLVGNVAQNRLDPIFYENRARGFGTVQALGPNGQPIVRPAGSPDLPNAPIEGPGGTFSTKQLNALQHIALYQAEFSIHQRWFSADGFYRVGHYHWGDEGDLFGIYRNAYYGPNLDIYNGTAPFGMVLSGHQALEGLKIAIGPELYWGANPAVVAKYRKTFGPATITLLHWEDVAAGSSSSTTSGAIREPKNRRTTLGLELRLGVVGLDIGGIMAGSTWLGAPFYWTRRTNGPSYANSGYQVLEDKVNWPDMFGGKVRLTVGTGRVRWYAQGQLRGVVSDGGPQAGIVLTDWSMQPSGRGNQVSASTGVTFNAGDFLIAPHFLYQQPLVPPIPQKILTDPITGQPIPDARTGQPQVVPAIGDVLAPNGVYFPGVRPRNVLMDPFAVRDNRLTYGFELLIAYDPTPGTWFFNYDRNLREDARFAFALDAVYRIQPTTTDSGIIVLASGAVVPIGGAAPAHDVWDVTWKYVANVPGGPRLFGSLYVAQKQSTGISPRLVTATGGDLTLLWKSLYLSTTLKFNDWGPYDYQRDFNLTYPVQWYGNLACNLSIPRLDWLGTRIGARAQVRTLDKFSDGYIDPVNPPGRGLEYEAGGYVMLSL